MAGRSIDTVVQHRVNSVSLDSSREVHHVDLNGASLPKDYHPEGSTTPNGVVLGAGNLVRGFLKIGNQQLRDALGRMPANLTFVDREKPSDTVINELQSLGYGINKNCPALAREDLEKALKKGLNPDYVYVATPADRHVIDAETCAEYNVSTYVEKPGYRVNRHESDAETMRQLVDKGYTQLVDFFLYGDSMQELLNDLERYLNGLGQVLYIHASCTEPHSVTKERNRFPMLMNTEANGGYIGSDQLPHPLIMIHAALKQLYQVGLKDAKFNQFFRAIDGASLELARELRIQLSPTAETCMILKGEIQPGGKAPIQLLAFSGKGPQIPGTRSQEPVSTYMLEIGCEKGRVEVCLGDLAGGFDPYIAIVPNDSRKAVDVFVYKGGGGGYKRLLADILAISGDRPEAARGRLALQTEGALQALDVIVEAQKMMDQNPDSFPRKIYNGDLEFPDDFTLACRVGPWVENIRRENPLHQ